MSSNLLLFRRHHPADGDRGHAGASPDRCNLTSFEAPNTCRSRECLERGRLRGAYTRASAPPYDTHRKSGCHGGGCRHAASIVPSFPRVAARRRSISARARSSSLSVAPPPCRRDRGAGSTFPQVRRWWKLSVPTDPASHRRTQTPYGQTMLRPSLVKR